ncbi:MAG: UDP-3-O-[3-hydroxymyristoyl] N-acetylglucosamine deacetylase [Rickettsiales bacterium]|jgi:UDP-3-O-[3-hydroxymyristoyl] N-acetylglucosamine deacetylase
MSITKQRTINKKVSCSGIGLHSGKEVKISLLPGVENGGIIFRRIDVKGENEIHANYKNVSTTNLGTTISNKSGVKVATIEHLMAAIWGCGIDNLVVEIDSEETPVMDGSSSSFIFLIECAGTHGQEEPRKTIEILKKIEVTDGDKSLSIEPDREFSVNLQIDFNHSQLGEQNFEFHTEHTSFKNDISRARTFAFEKDIDAMHAAGLALGGSLQNAVVIGENGVLNEDGVRYPDEFVRHKMLDFIGDIFLSGGYFIGKFTAIKSGHGINNQLLHKLFSDKTAYRII